MRRPAFALSGLLPALALAACNTSADAVESGNSVAVADAGRPFTVQEIADLDAPWAMTFIPGTGQALITEKEGKLLLWNDGGAVVEVAGIPAVDSEGQGGLMDVVLHPAFATNNLVYFSFSEAGAGGKAVALARGRLVTDEGAPRLEGVQVIFRASPRFDDGGHFSGRIAFAPDGHLFFTAGERQKFTPAQDPKATLGKVLRLNDDGTPAAGNPLAARGFHPAVWSYGHRNLLGIAFDAQGNLWEQEMGPRGGDEVNLIAPGRNYGWPNASNGSHYDGRDIPDHRSGDGYEPPKVSWNPVISPGGLIIYSRAMFPQWQGDAFIGGLSSKSLVRVDLQGTGAAKADQWDMGARIREVEQGPDGAIWLLEDGAQGSRGRLLKLTAAR